MIATNCWLPAPSAVFGPGTVIGEAAVQLVQSLAERLGLNLDDATQAAEA